LVGSGVKLYIGGIYTYLLNGMQPLLVDDKVLLLTTNAVGMPFTHEKYVPNFFRGVSNSIQAFYTWGQFMAKKYPDITKWSVIAPDHQIGHETYDYSKEALIKYYKEINNKTIEVYDMFATKPGQTDYRNIIASIMSSPVEGIQSGLYGEEVISWLTQSRAFGMEKKMKYIGDYSIELGIGKALGPNLPPQGLWSGTYWYYGAPNASAMSKSLYDDYVAMTGDKTPRGWVERGYSVLQILCQAIKAAKSTEVPQVIASLENGTFETPNGPYRFRKEDHQGMGLVPFIKMQPKPGTPEGWAVTDYYQGDAAENTEPATPGRPMAG
jgi:ABC-type branched-subunit amino acid transport system substrate-binding protein